MSQIFISYRRSDSQANTDRIFERLVEAFGRQTIFKDVDNIPSGVDFADYLDRTIQGAKIALIIIGRDWATAKNDDGALRLHNPNDYVRIEIERALQSSSNLVIPILVNNATMPPTEQLPQSLQSLTRLNAIQIRNDPDFHNDVNRLIRELREFGIQKQRTLLQPRVIGMILTLIVLVGVIGIIYQTETTPTSQIEKESSDTSLSTNNSQEYAETPQTPNNLDDNTTILLALERAHMRVDRNEQWQEWYPDGFTQEFNGVEMVLVPIGCFMMGSNSGDSDEKPLHEQCIDEPYWIDKYEVSQGQMTAFGISNNNAFAGNELPAENITWFEAQNFCLTRGNELPTELQWEYAARGVDSLIFPWGNEFIGNNLNYCDSNCIHDWKDEIGNDNYTHTAPVTAFSSGKSWIGAYQMAGNVWEWVSSPYQYFPFSQEETTLEDDEILRSLRGGSWNLTGFDTRAGSRNGGSPYHWFDDFGFRCARSVN